MTQAKTDGNSINALQPWEQPFDIELFEKEYFEHLRIEAHKAHIEKLENDPAYMAQAFESEDGSWKSFEDMDAYYAQVEINSAKQKIRELLEEINKQEAIINVSKRTIQKYKRLVQADKSNKRGRRTRSEYREEIVRKFTMKWVASLKDALEVKNCGPKSGLEKMVSSTTERNWNRWLKGDAIPLYTTFENLLDLKITNGKYVGEPLCKIPVSPTNNQMLTLLQFI